MNDITDRCRGCLFGLAVGDALGAAIEFRSPGSFEPITTYRTGGPHNLNIGEWTDDTSMALALADSLKEGWDLTDQAERYCAWLEEGRYSVNGWCFDIGATTRQALEQFMDCKDATKCGLTEASASGNGGIMRIAPVAIYACKENIDTASVFQLGVESSLVTHASDMCKSAAGLMTVMLYSLMNGVTKETVLEDGWYDKVRNGFPTLPQLHPAVDEISKGSYKRKNPPGPKNWWPGQNNVIQGSGFVVRSLEAALWAFYKAADYKEAVLAAVNLGEDSDTTGAICGQFAGAYWGESGIPKEWIDGLARKDMIEDALKGILPNITVPRGLVAQLTLQPENLWYNQMDTTNLYYAQFVARIMEAADALEAAGEQAVAAKNEQLFHEVHNMRMKCWDMASNLIKNPAETKTATPKGESMTLKLSPDAGDAVKIATMLF